MATRRETSTKAAQTATLATRLAKDCGDQFRERHDVVRLVARDHADGDRDLLDRLYIIRGSAGAPPR